MKKGELANQASVELDAVLNGMRKRISFSLAVRRYWSAAFAWCWPPDLLRWKVDCHESKPVVLSQRIRPSARKFAISLYSRGLLPLTKEAFEIIEDRKIQDNHFNSLAAQFGRVFGNMSPAQRPYYFYPVEDITGRIRKAYRLRADPDRLWIVVRGVADAQDVTDDNVDWSDFIEPPDNLETDSDATRRGSALEVIRWQKMQQGGETTVLASPCSQQ